ncbi:DsrE/DsrF/TusD sulfur relay family protein [Natronogracilivirga saccharolytica]|uniref:DsrE family protein n=1 Tax=Natronogracilivirga saccharolytica TaxID=2812953 RepID=A0A8J7S7U0_9BACT|nr:DsrE family protein [Natronogracilivirga saccharolytica]MBP3191813.1 DsrE family protein [Natronogracilivirga saccharolytica]
MKNILIIINDAPYGTEKAYNAMRIANQLAKDHKENIHVRLFLMADAALCAVAGQDTPEGYYNIERMLKLSVAKGAEIGVCGTCAKARGIAENKFVKGAKLSTMPELGNWIAESDQVMTF